MERDPNRIDPVLAAIREIWVEFPNMRLGQLLTSAIASESTPDLYNVEDTVLVRKLETLAKKLRKSDYAKDQGP